MEYFLDLPTILRHCMTDFFSIGGLIWMFRLRIVVCFLIALLYLLSPLDIIPEAAFGLFGLLDDMFVMFLLAIYISILYRRFIAHRATNEAGPIEWKNLNSILMSKFLNVMTSENILANYAIAIIILTILSSITLNNYNLEIWNMNSKVLVR